MKKEKLKSFHTQLKPELTSSLTGEVSNLIFNLLELNVITLFKCLSCLVEFIDFIKNFGCNCSFILKQSKVSNTTLITFTRY